MFPIFEIVWVRLLWIGWKKMLIVLVKESRVNINKRLSKRHRKSLLNTMRFNETINLQLEKSRRFDADVKGAFPDE
jgi:hypothetical protein